LINFGTERISLELCGLVRLQRFWPKVMKA